MRSRGAARDPVEASGGGVVIGVTYKAFDPRAPNIGGRRHQSRKIRWLGAELVLVDRDGRSKLKEMKHNGVDLDGSGGEPSSSAASTSAMRQA